MNPLHWKREHQHALIIISLFGAVAGVLFGFIHSSSFMILGTWQAFAVVIESSVVLAVASVRPYHNRRNLLWSAASQMHELEPIILN